MYEEKEFKRDYRKERSGERQRYYDEKTLEEIKHEILELFRVEKEKEGLFWAKLDTFIEKNCFFSGGRRDISLQEGWEDFFPEKKGCRIPGEVIDYARKDKMHFLVYRNGRARGIRSEVYLLKLLVDTAFKLAFIRKPAREYQALQDNVLAFVKERVPEELLNMDGLSLRVYKLSRLYLPDLAVDEKELVYVFSQGAAVLEKIFDDAASEYVRRKTAVKEAVREAESQAARKEEGSGKEAYRNLKEKAASESDAAGAALPEEEQEKGRDGKGQENGSSAGKAEVVYSELRDLLKRYESTISLLQEEIEEYRNECLDLKREIESLYEYASNRYEAAVKDMVLVMNRPEYGYVLSQLFLFACGKREFSLEDIRLFLRNFFVALEKMGVKAEGVEKVGSRGVFSARDIGDSFILDRDIRDAREFAGEFAMPGWQYKGKNVILPLVRVE